MSQKVHIIEKKGAETTFCGIGFSTDGSPPEGHKAPPGRRKRGSQRNPYFTSNARTLRTVKGKRGRKPKDTCRRCLKAAAPRL